MSFPMSLISLPLLVAAWDSTVAPGLLSAGRVDAPPTNDAQLVLLPLAKYPEARCLDGSPGGYYFRKGSGATGTRKWQIFFEGWGFCNSPEDCLDRSKGDHGSSGNWSQTAFLEEPYLSTSAVINPLTHDWNVAYLKSCDGAYFAGTRGEVRVGSATLHYSGEAILRAALSELMAAGLRSAQEVVLGGNSAGGICVLAQIDQIRQMLPQGARISGFSDSGFYLPTPKYVAPKRFVLEEQRAGRLLPSQCLKDNAAEPWRCMVSGVASAYLKTPVFAWESRFDTDQRDCALEESCQRSPACLEEYGVNMTRALGQFLAGGHGAGVFEDGCSHHCWSVFDDREWPLVEGQSAMQAFAEWYHGGRSHWRQGGLFPCTRCCPPKNATLFT